MYSARARDARGAAVPRTGLSSDAVLVSRVRHGDRRALRTLYVRYAGEILDFAVPITGTPHAETVVVQTFTTVWDRLRVGVKPPRVEPWLLGIAYSAALARPASARVAWPSAAVTAAPVSAACRWTETLTPRQYALVDLYIRRGLSVKELAAITGVAERSVQDRLERLRTDLEQFVASDLVLRRPASCAGLSVLLERFRGAEDADLRRAVRQHARLCDGCGAAAMRTGSALGELADLPTVAWEGDGAGTVWAAVTAYAAGHRAGQAEGTVSARRGLHRSLGSLAAAAAAVCVAGAALVVALDPFGGEQRVAGPNTVAPSIGSASSIFEPPRPPSASDKAAKKDTAPSKAAGQGSAKAGVAKEKPKASSRAAPQSAGAKATGSPPPSPPPGQAAQGAKAQKSKPPQAKAEGSAAQRPSQKPAAAAKPAAKPAAPPPPPPANPPEPVKPAPQARTLAWAPVGGALGYEVVLQRNGQEVYRTYIREARLVLPSEWTHNGRAVTLKRGLYRWIVWPLGDGQRRAAKAIVVSNLSID